MFNSSYVKYIKKVADVNIAEGNIDTALSLLNTAYEIYRQFGDEKGLGSAYILDGIGDLYMKKDDHTRSLDYYKRSNDLFLLNVGNLHIDYEKSIKKIYDLYQKIEDQLGASYYKELYVQTSQKRAEWIDAKRKIPEYLKQGNIHLENKEYDKAIIIFEKAESLQKKFFANSKEYSNTLEILAYTYQKNKKHNDALDRKSVV